MDELSNQLIIEGQIYQNDLTRRLYATDASAYREIPEAVIIPKNKEDLKKIVEFAAANKKPIIPRGAGTSLAGQVVGNGIVVDISKNLNKIIEVNTEEKYVWVEPGVVRDVLNLEMKKYGLFFGPETSTSNRCTIGGMMGNNACGAHLPVYGTTRESVLAVKAFLSNGSEVEFKELSVEEFFEKCKQNDLEGKIYNHLNQVLSNPDFRRLIKEEYPHPDIRRRNTGYALDLLVDTEPFEGNEKFNFCKLIAGSEGTLAFVYAIKLKLFPLPPKHKALLCVHFDTLKEALVANVEVLKFKPSAIELMDDIILELTKDNIEQSKNRFFIKGKPAAILIAEFNSENKTEIQNTVDEVVKMLKDNEWGYHYPVVWDNDTSKVWNLRKAGLGVLSNIPGDGKPQSVIEDTAVRPQDLPDYIDDFNLILKKYKLESVYYGHIATGELHLRPVFTMKTAEGVSLFRNIAFEIAKLVKKYRGSLSGEHGDGRLRGEYIPLMIGEENYEILRKLKKVWDPDGIFNPGKIIDTPPMDTSLRYSQDEVKEVETIFDFSETKGFIRAVEKCNGSGDCRKTQEIGGTMCPSFMATRNEWNTTRSRANVLREFITYGDKINRYDYEEIYQILDTCLSCKACKAECPSNVDMTKLKAEFLQHYYSFHRIPLRTKMIANFPFLNKLMSLTPKLSTFIANSKFAKFFTSKIGFAPQREIPAVHKPLVKWNKKNNKQNSSKPTVYLFNDEFTNLNDTDLGIKTILLLQRLGYNVVIPKHKESGRTYLSKGLVKKAKKTINNNLLLLKDLISEQTPLIGVEPSAILTFRDEALSLADKGMKQVAENISKNSLMFDEFFVQQVEQGKIKREYFTKKELNIKLHGHCYQKALASTKTTLEMLSFPENYKAVEIPSGCCGMAGSFGYEKEHYELSMKVGEMVLFPEVRKTSEEWEIVAPGTSCRHHIKHGTGRKSKHPIEIMYEALVI